MPATKIQNAARNSQTRKGIRRSGGRFPFQASVLLAVIFAVFVSGCTPPGPRALLKGKKLLERHDYAGAVEQFKTATKILSDNAQAWNYLGVAEQHAGQFSDAMLSYQRALTLNRDLVEAHYNLGCLYLSQNKVADAKTEFTAYTLNRGNSADGWTKLGIAQLREGEIVSAERSFSIAYGLQTNNVETLNGLGMARVQRNRPKEAAQFFAAALQYQPNFAPAILNLATVEMQYLHDDKTALEYYRKYLALTPRPANWDEVNALANHLEPAATQLAAANSAPAPNQIPTPAAAEKPSPEKQVHETPAKPPSPARTMTSPSHTAPAPETVKTQSPAVVSRNALNEKPSVASRLNTPRRPPPLISYTSTGAQAVQPNPQPIAPDVVIVPSAQPKPAPPPAFPRYHYLSPSKPREGNHDVAAVAFEKARVFERGERWREAADAYAEAARLDPAWFEAQYNLGVIAYRARNLSQSLQAYEMALAIRPKSEDARYNFALTLKGAGYAVDAVNELKRLVVENPADVRAHLALGNLYAQQLQDTALAREHYLKVLQIDPHNPQATDIGFWLAQHPQ